MKTNWTLDKLRETFYKMELDLDLFNKKILNIFFWKLIRADIITYTRGKLVNGEVEQKSKPKKQLMKKIVKNSFLENPAASPLYKKEPVDYYILDRGKKAELDGKLIDIFSYDIENEIIQKNYNYKIIDFPFFGGYFVDTNEERKNIESIFFYNKSEIQNFNIRLTSEEEDIFKTVATEFQKRFGFKINEIFHFRNKTLAEVKRFLNEYRYYKRLFLETKPKKIFTTIYYRRHSAVQAAKDLNITVVDIQYANVNINHPAFGFPEGVRVPYFPNEIMVWGEFFKRVTPYPNNAKVFIHAPSYFKRTMELYEGVGKEKDLITFASQHSVGEKLFQIAYNFSLKNPSYNIVFRLHPGELGKYENYKNYNEAINLNNFKLSSKDTDDLHELLARSEYQVGVYSTTMVEGILHKTKCIFANIQGVEEFESLYKNNYFPLINNEEELLSAINNFKFNPKTIDINEFFDFRDIEEILQ